MKKYSITMYLLLFVSLVLGQENNNWFILDRNYMEDGAYHTKHFEKLGQFAPDYNKEILKAIDKIQALFPDGGGYFAEVKAKPTESPIGYELKLFGKPLFKPERTTSFCSGSSYAVFIEALNMIFENKMDSLSFDRFESFKMEEMDGGRREDGIKFWGKWNDDGFGNHFSMVQYSGIGKMIDPKDALPGDFVNISWKSGNGHSTVFLGWQIDNEGEKRLVYFSSQKSTNGLADQAVKISSIKNVCFVRLTNPEKIFTFDINSDYSKRIIGNKIDW